jgi:S1-C subfamily serine protease
MKRQIAILLVVLCAGGGASRAAETDKPTLSVARITSSIPEGHKWGQAETGSIFGCGVHRIDLNWGVGAGRMNVRAFEEPTRQALKRSGFAIAGDATDPFAEKSGGDLAVGGTITAISSDFCFPISRPDRPQDTNHVSGSTSLDIDWQVYSSVERRVVAKVHTTGSYQTKVRIEGGFEAIVLEALNDSVAKLTASPEFQQAISQPTGPSRSATPSSYKSAMVLAGAREAKPVKIPDAVGAVVLVLSGGGHGSGFLVSSDGYLMTAEHVVGSDKYVKIRWSDGLEGVGEVIRTDKRRDVALIKTDPRGRQPLALRRESPQPGDTVFAIGAPIDPKLQNTVTRGVVSANRIMDGFSFIQSDVTVDPGNSGGPLLDEQGRVLGFTDKGLRTAEAPTGLNFFVPIDDALRFLSAEPQ